MPPPVNGEVTIVCLTDVIHLPDLGVKLTRGAKVEVPLSLAMRSRDLQRAKIDGTVSTQTLRASAIRAQELVSSDTTTSQSPRYVPPQQSQVVDLAPLLGMFQSLMDEVKSLKTELAKQTVGVPQKVEPGLPPPPQKVAPPSQDREEVFIPSNITGEGLKPVLDVDAQKTDAREVDAAAAALKSARRRSPR
jgi:hypothetical protein